MPEQDVIKAAAKLSEKCLSDWMRNDLGHISGLQYQTALQILAHWDGLSRFLTKADGDDLDIRNEIQVAYLLRNVGQLHACRNFPEIQEQIMEIDLTWKALRAEFRFNDTLVKESRERIESFIFEGGAFIMHIFLTEEPGKKEEIRRLVTAELLGRFQEVKYHDGDLQKEIAYPISESCERAWKENEKQQKAGLEIWEEDRLIPVMQIGEVPGHTCLSYKNGAYKQCLLSCFDANKKILFLSMGGRIVFRALVRLTKGSFSRVRKQEQELEFVDMLKDGEEKTKDGKEKPKAEEQLTLFLELPYIRRLPGDKTDVAIEMAIRMVKRKADKLNAQLVLSEVYSGYKYTQENFIRASYNMYISKSKNGMQYLDSLGGQATASNSGSYSRGSFLIWNDVAKTDTKAA